MNKPTKYPITVLVVDDEPSIVEQLSTILSRRVETVHTAANGQEGLERYREFAPDLIICDVDMPFMNGIEMLRKVREDAPNLPFILSTGLKNLDILIEAIGLGITAFLPKPVQLKDLLYRLENVARTKSLEKENAENKMLLEQYKTIVDTSSIVSKSDLAGNITYANDMFCKISGYTLEELIGKPHSTVRDPAMPPKLFEEMWQTIRSGKVWQGTIHNRAKDGSRYTVKSVISPIFNNHGEIVEYISLREDVTDTIKKDEQIRKERQKLNDILDHVNSIVAMVSKEEKLLFVNQKFFDVCLDENLEQFKRAHSCICDVFIPKEGFLQTMMGETLWIDYILDNPALQHKALILGKEGRERIFNVDVRQMKSDEKELFVVTLGDITELENAKEEAFAAARLKGEFLANMSHEIRTPMNGILGFTSLLSQTQMNQKQKQYVEILSGSTKTLLGIINDILDFSKLENGKLELDITAINPIVEFEKMAQLFHPKTEEKNITFDIDLDPRITECIHVDLLRMQQIVSNLIGNAIKFTPKNGAILFYARHLQDAMENRVRIRIGVKDSGIGISPEQQQKIFEAFSQADSSITRKFGGTGLGLSISSHLVSAMGGELKVQSQIGEGSDFYFDLEVQTCAAEHSISALFEEQTIAIVVSDHPSCMDLVTDYFTKLRVTYRLCRSSADLHPDDIVILFCHAEEEMIQWLERNNTTTIVVCNHDVTYGGRNFTVIPDLEHNLSALYNVLLSLMKDEIYHQTANLRASGDIRFSGRVLVAEDNSVNQMLIQEFLNRYGLIPEIVENGQEALDRLDDGTFDLVLMDVNMPVLSGTEAVGRIKQQKIPTPVVALTANVMEGDAQRFLAAGFDGYLTKPIIARDLEKVLSTYLHKDTAAKASSSETVSTPPPEPGNGNKLFDIELIRKELPFPETVLLKLLKAFSNTAGTHLQKLRDAVENKSREEIFQAAHHIKGSVGNLRIRPLEKIAAEIESLSRANRDADYDALFQQFEEGMHSLLAEIRRYLPEGEETNPNP